MNDGNSNIQLYLLIAESIDARALHQLDALCEHGMTIDPLMLMNEQEIAAAALLPSSIWTVGSRMFVAIGGYMVGTFLGRKLLK